MGQELRTRRLVSQGAGQRYQFSSKQQWRALRAAAEYANTANGFTTMGKTAAKVI
jgi:hypothetical protein